MLKSYFGQNVTAFVLVNFRLQTIVGRHNMSLIVKPVFGVSDQVLHKASSVQPQKMAKRLEISDFGRQLICTFVFTYAKNRFSHDGAHIHMTTWQYLFDIFVIAFSELIFKIYRSLFLWVLI